MAFLATIAVALLLATVFEMTMAYRRRNEWRRVQRAREQDKETGG